MIDIGKRIKELRELAKLESKDLAEILEVTPSYMSLLENNKRPCSIERIESICDALGITLGDFFNTKENKNISEDIEIIEIMKVNKELAVLMNLAKGMTKDKLKLVLLLCENMK